jgi:hypothetical protein
MTPQFRASFPSLHEPKFGPDGTGKAKYSVKMLFPKTMEGNDLKLFNELRAGIKTAALNYWGENIPKTLKKPLKDGDDADNDYDKGFWTVSARTDKKPGVVNDRNQIVDDPQKIGELIYPGCWCRATVLVGATETGGSKCVHLILQNIQFLKNGDRLDGRSAADQDFEPVTFSEEQADFEESDGF